MRSGSARCSAPSTTWIRSSVASSGIGANSWRGTRCSRTPPRTGRPTVASGGATASDSRYPFLSAAGSMRWHAGGGHTVHGGACRSGRVARQIKASGDIAIATPIAGRGGGARSGRGYVREHLVLRTAVSAELTMDELLDCVKTTDLRRLRACGRAVREHRRAVGAACRTGRTNRSPR